VNSFSKKILVTGGLGFIGSCLVRNLIAEGAQVLNLDRASYAANTSNLADAAGSNLYRGVTGDIGDRAVVAECLGAFEPDIIFHLAAETHVDRSIDGPADFIQTNVVGTCVLLEEALKYWHRRRNKEFKFIHISTDEVFGTLPAGGDELFRETTPYAPGSPYSASKASSDHFVRAWHNTYGFPAIVTNCSNNYGPYQFPEKLIPLMIINALNGHKLPVYGKGLNIRDWLHVEDHVVALKLIAELGRVGESYNIGGGAQRRNIDVVKQICTVMEALFPKSRHDHFSSLVEFVPDRPGHDLRYAIDDAKLKAETGWQPAFDFDTGLAATVEWYVANRNWWQPIVENKYAGTRMGLRKLAGEEIDL
jgi:dTDP-glucose 4,6-dehydratase